MRWTIYITALMLAVSLGSCQTNSQPVVNLEIACPAVGELSSQEQRQELIVAITKDMAKEQQNKLLALLKLWALDVNEILATYRQLKIIARCEDERK